MDLSNEKISNVNKRCAFCCRSRSATPSLLKWIFVATLTSSNLRTTAYAGGNGAVGNTAGGGGGSSSSSADAGEYFNCTSSSVTEAATKTKYPIKGWGLPYSETFALNDKKAYVFVNHVEWDCQSAGFDARPNDNLAILLSTTCFISNKENVRLYIISPRSTSVSTLFLIRLEGKTKEEAVQAFSDLKLTSSNIKGFVPDNPDDTFQQLIANSKTDNLTCEIGTIPDDPNTTPDSSLLNNFSRTSVLFVSVSFIILMVISLAWLVFYYVQRFRYAHAKDRLARRLFNAAKKALTKIPAKTLRVGDRELDSDCPVCIEPYHASDVIRILPCKHVFHKTCVDPWLLEHRTCPMCKMDILKAFGYNFGHSEESVRDADQLSAGGQSTDGRGVGFPVPLPTDSDLHDPFFPSPAPSPSLLQPVLHSNNTQSFSIIPLTVHNSGARGSDSSADSSEHWVSERHSAEVHRGALCDNSSAGSSSGSDDGHGDHNGRGVTQPLFRQARPSTSASAIIVGNSVGVGSCRLSSATKHDKLANVATNNSKTASRRRKSTKSTKHSPISVAAAAVNTNNRPRSASSQNLGSASIVIDPSLQEGRISCGLRNDAAPSLESL